MTGGKRLRIAALFVIVLVLLLSWTCRQML